MLLLRSDANGTGFLPPKSSEKQFSLFVSVENLYWLGPKFALYFCLATFSYLSSLAANGFFFVTFDLFIYEQVTCIAICYKFFQLISCVCPVVDHEFRHDIVKVAVNR